MSHILDKIWDEPRLTLPLYTKTQLVGLGETDFSYDRIWFLLIYNCLQGILLLRIICSNVWLEYLLESFAVSP